MFPAHFEAARGSVSVVAIEALIRVISGTLFHVVTGHDPATHRGRRDEE